MSALTTAPQPIPSWARRSVYALGLPVVMTGPAVAALNVGAPPRPVHAVGLLPAGAAHALAIAVAALVPLVSAVVLHAVLTTRSRRAAAPEPAVRRAGEETPAAQVVVREVVRAVRVAEPMRPADEETDVYRLFDGVGDLLYVGIGSMAPVRWRDHARRQWWWHDVARHVTVRYPFRGQALAVEQSAIAHERPRHNRHGGSLNDPKWTYGWDQPRPVLAELPAARANSQPHETQEDV